VPVEVDLRTDRRLPEPLEVAVYYVVSEALTNATKHSRASSAHVALDTDGAIVHLSIYDDGIGGAEADRGSGLVGLRDRIEALGGSLEIISPVGNGTTLRVHVPVGDRSDAVSSET
jgi:signal transduction histidine kinase